MPEEETGNAFEKACAKLTSDEMAVMVRRALAVYQVSIESKPKVKKVELPPIDVRLEELATYLTEEETQIKLQAGATGLPGVKSALAVSNLVHTGFRGEPRRCYRCGERGGEEAGGDLLEEDQALVKAYSQGLRNMQKLMSDMKSVRDGASTSTSSRGNFASLAYTVTGTHDTLTLASIPTTRSPDWIANSGASRHVTGTVGEFSSYTRLAVTESIQIADGTAQPIVGKGIVKYTDLVTLTNVSHAPSFSVNLVSISANIREHKCIVTFDIPKMVFQEKGTGLILGTGTWHDGFCGTWIENEWTQRWHLWSIEWGHEDLR